MLLLANETVLKEEEWVVVGYKISAEKVEGSINGDDKLRWLMTWLIL